MDATRDDHTSKYDRSKSERERQILSDITYMGNLIKYHVNEPIYETETESRDREQTGSYREVGASRCKLIYMYL